jgi:zinc protease
MIPDYTRTTPEAMQALAARYLGKGSSWRLAVIPEGQKLAGSYGEGADAAAQH